MCQVAWVEAGARGRENNHRIPSRGKSENFRPFKEESVAVKQDLLRTYKKLQWEVLFLSH